MNPGPPPCRTIDIITFRGDRSKSFAGAMKTMLNDQEHGRGPGPTRLDCIILIGHSGISIDDGISYFGFGPTSAQRRYGKS